MTETLVLRWKMEKLAALPSWPFTADVVTRFAAIQFVSWFLKRFLDRMVGGM